MISLLKLYECCINPESWKFPTTFKISRINVQFILIKIRPYKSTNTALCGKECMQQQLRHAVRPGRAGTI